jgi:hypothetical protein
MRKRMRELSSSLTSSPFLLFLGTLVLVMASVPAWAAAGDEPPRSLSPEGLQNLEAFTRLLGYVRFFHPSDQAVAADWDQVAIAGIQQIESATSPPDLASSLQSFFQPLAPTLRVYPEGDRPPLPGDLLPPAGTPNPMGTYWQYYGVQLPLTPPYTYTSSRVDFVGAPPAITGLFVPAAPEVVSLGRGVDALLPLTLYTDAEGTIPPVSAAAPTPNKPAGWTPSGNDRATRLAGVAEAWTVLQHFYPYFDLFNTDWSYQLVVETYRLGDRVGETTAGTNGNVNYIVLPGNYTLRFSGMRVTKHDGARFEGVGVPVTVPVERTYAGIAAGRDEYLERAIEVVRH